MSESMTGSAALREAARVIRARAVDAQHDDAVQPGLWATEHHSSPYHEQPDSAHISEDRKGHYWTVAHEVYIPIAEHMAGLDPHFALTLAAAFDAEARRWFPRKALVAAAQTYLSGASTIPVSLADGSTASEPTYKWPSTTGSTNDH